MRPELDGHAVMQHLGLKPGPDVGAALDFLLELRLDEGVLGEEEATRRLDEWWATAPRVSLTSGVTKPSLRPRMTSVVGTSAAARCAADFGLEQRVDLEVARAAARRTDR